MHFEENYPRVPSPRDLIRSPLVRATYDRLQRECECLKGPNDNWYACDVEKLQAKLQDKFVRMHKDQDTTVFLENSAEKSNYLFLQLYHLFFKTFFHLFATTTSINGWLGRGSMFVFSESQFASLLDFALPFSNATLLDIGAGDGNVTRRISSHFTSVYTVELSPPMISRLSHLGYRNLAVNEWQSGVYDVIACLNVLDRCDKPRTMLKEIRSSLRPDTGIAIVAAVIPFSQYVEMGETNQASEIIAVDPNASFEEQLAFLADNLFEPLGFDVIRFTRLPYLCEGDLEQSFYVLDDCVFVLRPRTEIETPVGTNTINHSGT